MPKRRRRRYPTDLTDGQWAVLAPRIPDAEPGGRPRKADKREIVDAILYFLGAGCAWRLLPHDFPPWQTVYHYLRGWEQEGVWARVHHRLVMVLCSPETEPAFGGETGIDGVDPVSGPAVMRLFGLF